MRVPGRHYLIAVFFAGWIARVVLIPLGHGQDFVVWDHATAATLHGVNIYAHHPNYPGGPYAYFPLFLYLELPMQWLAVHAGLSFTVLGKLPILAGDVATTALIGDAVARSGRTRCAASLAAAAFWLNPLVLYDSAYYGRFDSMGCALLLLAMRRLRRQDGKVVGSAVWYGLAVAAKTFPVVAVAGVFRATRRARKRAVLATGAVFVIVLVPYLGSLQAVYHDAIEYDATKSPQGLSWQAMLQPTLDAQDARRLGYVLFALFVAATVGLSRITDLDRYVVLTLLLFVCASKVVLEQYLVWPIPFLAILAATHGGLPRRYAAGTLLATLTAIGSIANETYHPFGRGPTALVLLLLVACLTYVGLDLRHHPRATPHGIDRHAPPLAQIAA